MCLFVYTLSTCSHSNFQNVAECPVAQGFCNNDNDDNNNNNISNVINNDSNLRMDMTLAAPKFLFDTARSHSRTPDFYKAVFNCKKRKATRPVPGLCRKCLRDEAKTMRLKRGGVTEVAPLSVGRGIGMDNSVAGIGQPTPFDSESALVSGVPRNSSFASTSASDSTSSTVSGMSLRILGFDSGEKGQLWWIVLKLSVLRSYVVTEIVLEVGAPD